MWLVVIDRPYYPSVTVYDTEQQAREAATTTFVEENEKDGKFDSRIYVAKIHDEKPFKSSY